MVTSSQIDDKAKRFRAGQRIQENGKTGCLPESKHHRARSQRLQKNESAP